MMVSAAPTLRLRHDEAQAVMLVRAVEETDRRAELLPHELRREATSRALEAGDDAAWLGRRATALVAELERRWPFLPRLLGFTNPGRSWVLPLAIVAFFVGLATNALGPQRQIHVLALPLAGILVWNLAIMALLVLRRWLPLGRFAWRGPRPLLLDALEGWCRRLVERLPSSAAEDSELVRRALAAYLRLWLPTVAPLAAARVRRLLHLAALSLIAGAVAGMYLRGVVFAYRATWESTFIGAATVERVLDVVLGPAAAVLATEVPSAEPLERFAGDQAAGGDAAPWIHLWAVTAALFAALPRAALAAAESLRAARLARRLPLSVPAVYARRLLAAVSAEVHRIEVVPYSYRPGAAVNDALRARLLDFFGARSEIRFHRPVDYGGAPAALELAAGRAWIVLFNLAQTPEIEVHGRFLAALAGEVGDGQSLVAAIDGSLYRQRLPPGEAAAERLQERRRTWSRVVAAAGLEALHLDLRCDSADAVVAAFAALEERDGG